MNNSGKITSNCNVASIRVENPNTSYDFYIEGATTNQKSMYIRITTLA